VSSTWKDQAEAIAVAIRVNQCPDCGAPLTIDDEAEKPEVVWHAGTRANGGMPYLATHLKRCSVAFCTDCEFAVELS
jgi:hypothetical protein